MAQSIWLWQRLRWRSVIVPVTIASLVVVLAQIMLQSQAAIMPVKTADAFVNSIGVVTHLRYLDTAYSQYDDIIKPRLLELGVRHIRDGGRDPVLFQRLNDLARSGIKATLVMDSRDSIIPANVIAEVISPVLPAIEAAEGPNEWDVQRQLTYNGLPFPEGVRLYQTELYNAVKINPPTSQLPVLMPSLAIPFNAPQLGYLEALDAGNMHSYAGGNLPSQDLDTKWIPLTKVVAGEKPIVATETGWHTAIADPNPPQPAVSERTVGIYVPRLFLEYFNRNIQRTFIYELIDQRDGPGQENNFGLLRFNGTPKPSFTALKNLITLLNDPGPTFQPQSLEYELQGDLANIRHTVLQKRDRRFYIIIWQDVRSFNTQARADLNVPEQTVTLKFQTPLNQVNVYQPVQSLTPFLQRNALSELTLQVADSPLVVELVPS